MMLVYNTQHRRNGLFGTPTRAEKTQKQKEALSVTFFFFLVFCHFEPLSLCGENPAYILNQYLISL